MKWGGVSVASTVALVERLHLQSVQMMTRIGSVLRRLPRRGQLCPVLTRTAGVHRSAPCQYQEGQTPVPLLKREDVKGENPSGYQAKRFKGNVNYFPDFIHSWTPAVFRKVGYGMGALSAASFTVDPALGVALSGLTGGYWYLGLTDMQQTRHTIRRNFPVLGHMRYILEQLRPEIYQYFV